MPCFSEAESRGERDDIDVVRVPANKRVRGEVSANAPRL
jgi:hypothetical protein